MATAAAAVAAALLLLLLLMLLLLLLLLLLVVIEQQHQSSQGDGDDGGGFVLVICMYSPPPPPPLLSLMLVHSTARQALALAVAVGCRLARGWRCAAVAATGGLLAARSIWAGYADEARRRIIAPAKAGSSSSKQKQ